MARPGTFQPGNRLGIANAGRFGSKDVLTRTLLQELDSVSSNKSDGNYARKIIKKLVQRAAGEVEVYREQEYEWKNEKGEKVTRTRMVLDRIDEAPCDLEAVFGLFDRLEGKPVTRMSGANGETPTVAFQVIQRVIVDPREDGKIIDHDARLINGNGKSED